MCLLLRMVMAFVVLQLQHLIQNTFMNSLKNTGFQRYVYMYIFIYFAGLVLRN